MDRLTREDLYSLEEYAELRSGFRARVISHKKGRQIAVGPNATLYFEDRLTVQYQIQEMLRVERIFERSGIEAELDAYNPLIPDGTNLKATFMLEYADEGERRRQLNILRGVERTVWIRVDDGEKRFAIADEDLDRETAEKTSSVHFLRFELEGDDRDRLRSGAGLFVGIDHASYVHQVEVLGPGRDALAADLD